MAEVFSTKNYEADGGDTWVINGKLTVGPDAEIEGLNGGGGTTAWADIADKPVVIASGDDQAAARAAIGAGTGNGTSNLTIGTTGTTAAAGNHTHSDMASASALADLTSRVAALEEAGA